MIINGSGNVFWKNNKFVQNSLVVYQDSVNRGIIINVESLDFLGPMVSQVCPPLSPMDPVEHDVLDKLGVLFTRILW